jgi:hypothetical protein
MKTSLRFSATELTLLLLQSAALGGILTLGTISGPTSARVMIGVATLLLILHKVAGGIRRGKLEPEATPVPATDRR